MRSGKTTGRWASRALLATFLVTASGCRIEIVAPPGAIVRSESGAFDCVGPDTCAIDVNDLFFDETFSVDTSGDVVFAGWKTRDRGLCGGSTAACRLATAGFAGNEVLLGILESDDTFFLEAELASAIVSLAPVRDTTIFSDEPEGAISDGRLFVGRNRVGSVRRALLAFDLSAIPPGSTINSATLTLTLSDSLQLGYVLRVHRLEAPWGEGATVGAGGAAAQPQPAMAGDATWHYRMYADERWDTRGGDFVTTASASRKADAIVTWTGEGLRADVQRWVEDEPSNFGWILIGNETTAQSVQGFYSRESAEIYWPTLRVAYTEPR